MIYLEQPIACVTQREALLSDLKWKYLCRTGKVSAHAFWRRERLGTHYAHDMPSQQAAFPP